MKIKELRETANLTQNQVAAQLKVTREAVSQWECGIRTPRADKLPDLAKILGCTIDELFEEEG